MKKLLLPLVSALLLVFGLAIQSSFAQSVIISQYIETSSGSTPKGIEIFNVSGSDITFSAGNNLRVYKGSNGGSCNVIAGINITSGTLAADKVWVIGTSNLTAYANTNGTGLSGTTNYTFSFNGDDALQVYLGGVEQDEFGTCGSDPGSAWSGGGMETRNDNLEIQTGICTGSTGWTDPSARFDYVAIGTDMSGFGNAPAACAPPTASNCSGTLSGTYTINASAAASCTNYQDFASAVSDMVSGSRSDDNDYRHDGGISGPVVFDVTTGTYAERIVIPEITGVTATNTVTFKSASGTNTDVILTMPAENSSTPPNYVVMLDGADYIRFEDMTLSRTTVGLNNYAAVVLLDGDASDNTFDNCVLSSVTTTQSSDVATIVLSQSTSVQFDNVITNGSLLNGSNGIRYESDNGGQWTGFEITNNTFTNQRGRAIDLEYMDAMLITGNTISTNSASTSYDGMYLFNCDASHTISGNTLVSTGSLMSEGIYLNGSVGSHTIKGNYIYASGSGRIGYGIRIASSGATSPQGQISNNSIQVENGSGTAYGLNMASSENIDVLNNTFYVSAGTSGSTYPFYCSNSTDAAALRNNIFVNESTASTGTANRAIYLSSTTSFQNGISNNAYYTANTGSPFRGRFGSDYTDFASYQTATGETGTPQNIDPVMAFVGGTGWKASETALANGAPQLSGITTDVDALSRYNPTTIGAHELGNGTTPPVADFSASATSTCPSTTVTFTDATNNTPTSWAWSFSPNTVTYVGATSSSSQNPQVQFTNAGLYEVTLDATNGDGSDDEVKTDYIAVGLSGTYTIGGTTPDYATFTEAVTDLNALGVCGPVVFDARTGTYTEQISIDQITGASATNTITFQSETGTNTDVTLQFASSASSGDPNYVAQLNGSDYITIQNMTVQRTGTNNYARVIDVSGDASYNTITGNILTGDVAASPGSSASQVVYSDNANTGNTNNTISNNTIRGGYHGVFWEGTSSLTESDLTISGNDITSYRYGMYISYVDGVTISGNIITTPTQYNSSSVTGIICRYADGVLNMTGNTITLTGGSTPTGIEMLSCNGNSNFGLIANNMISIGGTNTSQGIDCASGTSYKNFYYNSVYTSGTNASSASAFYLNGANNINLRNNAFYATIGVGMEILAETTLTSDYNDIYSDGTDIGVWDGNHPTLASFQASNSSDANSISADPSFISATDLHVNPGSPTDATAVNGLGITTDIDGETRNVSTPDIGADEYESLLPIVTLSADVTTGTEAAQTVITLTATASIAVTGSQTINVTVAGTGITAGDYTLGATTIAIANGATTGTVTFTVIDDILDEGDETAEVTISHPSSGGYIIGSPAQQDIVIEDNDAPTCYELMISEYHEAASGNEKYVEVYNPTASAITLAGIYDIVKYNNGSSSVGGTLALTGSVAAYSAVYIANSSAALSGSANATDGNVTTFNGNDVIALRKNGTNIDVVGTIGSSANFGANVVLRRQATIDAPTTTYDAGEWTSSGANDVSDIGQHTSDCFVSLPVVTLGINTATGTEAGTTQIILTATADVAVTGNQTVVVALSGTGLASTDFTSVDFTSTVNITINGGATVGTITFNIADDSDVEGTETATFTVGSPSSGIVVGTPNAADLAITDDDNVTSTESVIIEQGGEAANISSLSNGTITNSSEGTQVWQFNLYDGDGTNNDADSKPTIYEGFTIRQSVGNTVPVWDDAINNVKFFLGASATPISGSFLVSASTVTFTPTTPITVTDGTTPAAISMRITLDASLPASSDGQYFGFSLDDSDVTVETDVLLASQLGTFTETSNAALNGIDITATLQFIDAPAAVTLGSSFSVTVSAVDANGNVDTGISNSITLSHTSGTGTLTGAPSTANMTSGTYTFTGLSHDTEEVIEITVQDNNNVFADLTADITVTDEPHQLFDDFNRADNVSVGIPSSGGSASWTEDQIANDAFRASIDGNELYLGGCAAGVNSGSTGSTGMEQVGFNVESYYETVLDDGGSTYEWLFNMKQTRPSPSGFGSNTYVAAVILGSDATDFQNSGADGYAVIIGNGGSPDPVKLVRFTGGLTSNSNVTDVAVSSETDADAYYSVKVTFNPCNDEWSLYVRDDGTSTFSAPNVGGLGSAVTGIDNTHTGLDLKYFGAGWQHSSGCGEYMRIDNMNIPNTTPASSSAKTWNGSVNADWNEANNWGPCPGVPTNTNEVIIANVATQPIVSASPTAFSENLTINSGASLTINAGQYLNAWGDVVNNGSADFGDGTFTMEGNPSTLSLTGNVNVANYHVSTAVTLNGTVTVSDIARSELNGAITSNGNLVLENGAQLLHGTGTTFGGGTVSGNIVVKRVGNGSGGFNGWSTPVVGGNLPGSNGYSYNSTLGTNGGADDNNPDPDPGWVSQSGTMTGGKGYFSTNGGSVTFTGTANNGNYNPTVTGSAEPLASLNAPSFFNLIGNPYPSAIDADQFIADNSSRIDGALYFWSDENAGSAAFSSDDYATYSTGGSVVPLTAGGGGGVPNGSIPSCQGFFVNCDASGTINFNNGQRGGSNNQFFRLAASDAQRMWLSINNDNLELFNQTLVAFDEFATDQKDWGVDAYKFRGNPAISIGAQQDGETYVIATYESIPQSGKVIPLMTYVETAATYTFVADSMEGLDNHNVYLEDLSNGSVYPMLQGDSYSFAMTSADEFGRFQLWYSPMLITGIDEAENNFSIYATPDNMIVVETAEAESLKGTVQITDMAGRMVLTNNISIANGIGRVQTAGIANGIYAITFVTADGNRNASKKVALGQ